MLGSLHLVNNTYRKEIQNHSAPTNDIDTCIGPPQRNKR